VLCSYISNQNATLLTLIGLARSVIYFAARDTLRAVLGNTRVKYQVLLMFPYNLNVMGSDGRFYNKKTSENAPEISIT
jgi:hypothetical protein